MLYREVESKIKEHSSSLEQKANKTDIGTPLIASSISEMIDKTKVYVNTTDSKWYSWNGTNWISGGIYNSQGIANNSITPEKTSFIKVQKIDNKIIDKSYRNNYLLNNVGAGETSATHFTLTTAISVSANDNYIFSKNGKGIDISKVVFKTTNVYNDYTGFVSGKVNIASNVYITVPQNALYMYVSFYNSSGWTEESISEFLKDLVLEKNTIITPIEKNKLIDIEIPYVNEKISSINNEILGIKTSLSSINLFPKEIEVLENKQLNGFGWTEDVVGKFTIKTPIPVTEGETYSFALDDFPVIPTYISVKKNNSLSDYVQTNLISRVVSKNKITIPVGGNYIFLTFEDWVKSDLDKIVVSKGCSAVKKRSSNLKNKKIMTLGDSLTELGMWQNYMCGRLEAKDYLNLAIGGKKVYEFVENVNSDNIKDIDIVTIMGFFNNGSNIAGNISDLKSSEPTSSVCSQYKYIIEYLYNLKKDINIVLITPHRPSANDVSDKVEIVKQLGKLYGIPVIDTYNNAGFNDLTYDIYLSDDVHSNREGYKKEATYITAQIESIINSN